MSNSYYEYRMTFAIVPEDFPHSEKTSEDMSKICPKPPKGEDWQLVSSTSVVTKNGPLIFYYWERPSFNRDSMN